MCCLTIPNRQNSYKAKWTETYHAYDGRRLQLPTGQHFRGRVSAILKALFVTSTYGLTIQLQVKETPVFQMTTGLQISPTNKT
jgi:hypothetical protein